jgi:hypothetical protein
MSLWLILFVRYIAFMVWNRCVLDSFCFLLSPLPPTLPQLLYFLNINKAIY